MPVFVFGVEKMVRVRCEHIPAAGAAPAPAAPAAAAAAAGAATAPPAGTEASLERPVGKK